MSINALCRLSTASFFCILFLSGCVGMEAPEPPELTLANLKFTDATLFETNATATLRVINPAPEAIEIQGASLKLIVDGHTLGRGVSQAQLRVEGLSTASFDAEFHINNASAVFRLRQIMENRVMDYAIRGKLYLVETSGRQRSVRIDRSGHLDIDQTLHGLSQGESAPSIGESLDGDT